MLKDKAYCLLGWLGVDEIAIRDLEQIRMQIEQAYDQGWIDDDHVRDKLIGEIEKASKEISKGAMDKSREHLLHLIEITNKNSGMHIRPKVAEELLSTINNIIDEISSLVP